MVWLFFKVTPIPTLSFNFENYILLLFRYISSGLHHDYHDNLYVLLRGSKKITLYSPAYAEKMYTVGEISRVHPNGRINYVGQETLADGERLISTMAAHINFLLFAD